MRNIINFSIFLVLFLVLINIKLEEVEASSNERNIIQVTGNGKISAEPDKAVLTLSIETNSSDASLAISENSKKANNVVNELKSKLGDDDNITTSGFNLKPVYEYQKDTKKSELTGYLVSNKITIETRDLQNIGELIDSITQLGANRIFGLVFDTDKRDEYRRKALVKAVNDAKETAKVVAEAAGVKISRIIQITPSYNFPAPIYREFDYASKVVSATPPIPTPIESGVIDIEASVNIIYSIE